MNENGIQNCPHKFDLVDAVRFLFRCRNCKKGTSPGWKAGLKAGEKAKAAGAPDIPALDDPELGKIEIRCPTCLNDVSLVPAMLTDSKMVSDWWEKCQAEDFELLTFDYFRCRRCGNEKVTPIRWAKAFKYDPKKPGDIFRGNYEPTEPTGE